MDHWGTFCVISLPQAVTSQAENSEQRGRSLSLSWTNGESINGGILLSLVLSIYWGNIYSNQISFNVI